MELGRVLQYATVTAGLRRLNPRLHFDMAGALGLWHPRIKTVAGVFYDGRHICAIDRGEIPEFPVRSVATARVEIPPGDVSTIEGAWTSFNEIPPWDARYAEGLEKSAKFDDGYAFENGQLRLYQGWVTKKVPGRFVHCGWRMTFEAILRYGVAGVTRQSLSKQFNVDMNIVPAVTPEILTEVFNLAP